MYLFTPGIGGGGGGGGGGQRVCKHRQRNNKIVFDIRLQQESSLIIKSMETRSTKLTSKFHTL